MKPGHYISKRDNWMRQQQQFTLISKLCEDVNRDLNDIKARIDMCGTDGHCAVDLKDYEALEIMRKGFARFKDSMSCYRQCAQEQVELMFDNSESEIVLDTGTKGGTDE